MASFYRRLTWFGGFPSNLCLENVCMEAKTLDAGYKILNGPQTMVVEFQESRLCASFPSFTLFTFGRRLLGCEIMDVLVWYAFEYSEIPSLKTLQVQYVGLGRQPEVFTLNPLLYLESNYSLVHGQAYQFPLRKEASFTGFCNLVVFRSARLPRFENFYLPSAYVICCFDLNNLKTRKSPFKACPNNPAAQVSILCLSCWLWLTTWDSSFLTSYGQKITIKQTLLNLHY